MADDAPTRRVDPDDQPTVRGLAAGRRVFGRYTLEAVAGRGGMGVVWRARDERLERPVALKFLPEVVAADHEAVRELLRETRRCLDLTHPNIVRVHDLVQDDQMAAIAMEFIDGESLAKRKAAAPGGRLALEDLAPLAAQLCAALAYAHGAAKVVHRDLKPANLLVTRDGQLKVTDFGIARSLSDTHTRLTGRTGDTSGTLLYMSPQQLVGADPSAADDIYSLGATLYELLTGKPPFHSGDVTLQIRELAPPPLNARLAALGAAPVPPAWEKAILACLAKEPKDRPPSAAEVAARLGLTAAGDRRPAKGQVAGVPPASVGTATPPSPKSKVSLYAGLAVAVLLLAALGGWYFGRYQPEQRHLAAEQSRVAAEKRVAEEKRRTDEKRAADERVRQAAAQKLQAEEQARREALGWVNGLPLAAPDAEIAAVGEKIDHYAQTAPAEGATEVRAAFEKQRSLIQAERERVRLANARGGLIVKTTPPGAEVQLGSLLLDQKTPVALKAWELGKYPVVVRLPGYEEERREVVVKENQIAELEVALVRSTGTLNVSSAPAGLPVDIVERPAAPRGSESAAATRQAATTPATLTLPTGDYALTFHRAGWPDQQQMVTVGRQQTAEATASFAGGTVAVSSTPAGAEVWAGETRLGVTPLELADRPPGELALQFRLKDFRPAEARTVVTPGARSEVSATLARLVVQPSLGQPWENTLGMKFVPVRGTSTLMCIWETRVQDFTAFVQATGYAAEAGVFSNRGNGWKQQGDTWRSPGFAQWPSYPVCAVNWDDAVAFCRWLTTAERTAGRLGPGQEYRLPTDAEWSLAAGLGEEQSGTPREKSGGVPGVYPWGTQWPPPPGAGNYADESARRGRYEGYLSIAGYNDGYDATAPVGSFTANAFGIYDLGGNVWEWCSDYYNGTSGDRVVRGASFLNRLPENLLTSYRGRRPPTYRGVDVGFRCVLAMTPR